MTDAERELAVTTLRRLGEQCGAAADGIIKGENVTAHLVLLAGGLEAVAFVLAAMLAEQREAENRCLN